MSEGEEIPAKLLRTAKGKRPRYFADPDADRLLAIVVSLIGEVSVLRERLDTLERLADRHGLLAREQIERFAPTAEEQAEREQWRQQYLERVFRILQTEREELAAGRRADLDAVIEAFTAGRI